MIILQDRANIRRQFVETAFALAEYRAATGRYPAKLEDLVPKYLPTVPEDCFSMDSHPIQYRRNGDVYVLWSVGFNGLDDGGKDVLDSLESNATDKVWDDFIFRPTEKRE